MPHPEIELWAGAECSVVRVGDTYVDQLVRTGHDKRLDDFDRLAALGVRAVRLPVLWERVAPDGLSRADWAWSDEALARVRDLGMRPIVGLVHHGSGPRHTSLLEPSFAEGLEVYARAVARRYPWVQDWTPVNEPLTTARFSALYGHWYPHERSGRSFARALVHECSATRAAMNAIRESVPAARLVQTEDVGTVSSTKALAYQARFENVRRFASLDLLTGRLGRRHALHRYLLECGVDPRTLESFVRAPCPPDIVGLNYYVTSDRFLDHRVHGYPGHVRGGNGHDVYADVEAARVLGAGIQGHSRTIELLWRRYRRPIALTEVHLGCAPEEQARWLSEAWAAAKASRARGADVRAVTVWSAFGAVDWDSLLVLLRGHYEPGLFDVRDGRVRPTALSRVARELAACGESAHPVLATPGWWHRPERLAYPPVGRLRHRGSAVAPPILIIGGHGLLGSAIARVAHERALPVVVVGRAELDVTDFDAVVETLRRIRPWAVVNAASSVRVDETERDEPGCWDVHAYASERLAVACRSGGIRLVSFSSNLVFDGQKTSPYLEDDGVAPLSVYGRAKADGERRVLAILPDALVVRSSAFFGPWDQKNFVTRILAALRARQSVVVSNDLVVSPTYLPDLAHAVLTLLVDGASGIWHLANRGALTYADVARRAARGASVSDAALDLRATTELGLAAPRPRFSALSTKRGAALPSIEEALQRYCEAIAS